MKKKIDVVRAWKDEEYRNSLSDDERQAIPDNPAGVLELSDSDLLHIVGGAEVAIHDGPTHCKMSTGCCSGLTDASCIDNCSTCPE